MHKENFETNKASEPEGIDLLRNIIEKSPDEIKEGTAHEGREWHPAFGARISLLRMTIFNYELEKSIPEGELAVIQSRLAELDQEITKVRRQYRREEIPDAEKERLLSALAASLG